MTKLWIGALVVFLGVGAVLSTYPESTFGDWLVLLNCLRGLAAGALAVFLVALYQDIADRSTMRHADRQAANSQVGILGLARTMEHLPAEAIRVLDKYGSPLRTRIPSYDGNPPRTVIYGTNVSVEFARHMLKNSDEYNLHAIRNFADGAYHWDTSRTITDRDQAREFVSLLVVSGMATTWGGNMSAQWVGEWGPKNVAAWLGIELDDEETE